MNRIVAVFCRTLLACTIILATGGTSYAGVREEAERLRAATKMWSPMNYNNDVVAYIDPYSIFKVNEKDWDINITFVNNQNMYIAEDTFTYRIDCENIKVQKQGWRVDGYLKEYKGPLGLWVMNPTRASIKSGSLIENAKNYVCGRYSYSNKYYYIVSMFRDNKIKSVIDEIWIKDNSVYISNENRNIRRAELLTAVFGNPQGNLSEFFANCYDRKYIEVVNGQAITDWSSVPTGSGIEVVFDRMCSNKFSFISYQNIPISLPKPKLAAAPQTNQSQQTKSENNLEDAKRKCAALGFSAGTPKFGQCVLQISK